MRYTYEEVLKVYKERIEEKKSHLKIIEDFRSDMNVFVPIQLHEIMGMCELIEELYGMDKYEELNNLYEEFHEYCRQRYEVA